jgi:hypothetical protein
MKMNMGMDTGTDKDMDIGKDMDIDMGMCPEFSITQSS